MKRLALYSNLFLFAASLAISSRGGTVTWNSGSGDWDNPTNWSSLAVPGSGDAVVIPSGPGITVTHSSNIVDTVLSIQCSQTLVISNGSITVTAGSSQLSAGFYITNGATLVATGAGTTLLCSGAVDADDGDLAVGAGAVMTLQTLKSYNADCGGGNCYVTGTNSVLNFPVLTNLIGGGCSYPVMQAESGGQIVATNLVNITSGPLTVQADGVGSLVDFRGLKTCSGQNGYPVVFEISGGGSLLITNLANANLVALNFTGATMTFPKLTNDSDGNFTLNSGGQVTAPALTNYTKTCYGTSWAVTGTNSILNFPVLTNITGDACSYPVIKAESGGQILAPNLGVITAGPLTFQADGSGSVINLSKLTNCAGQNGYYVEFEASAGGLLEISNLQGGQYLNFTYAGVAASFPDLTNFVDGNVSLSAGAVVTMPDLKNYTKTCQGANWLVTGAGSELNLPALTNISGQSCNYPAIQAESGGQILMSSVVSILGGPLAFAADGANSLIDLAALTNCSGQDGYFATFEASAGGTIEFPLLKIAPGTGITVNPGGNITLTQIQTLGEIAVAGVTNSFSSLTNFPDGNITISGGANVTLSALRDYTKECVGGNWSVTGSNSVLNFPLLTNITETACNYPIIQAESGGVILLTNVRLILAGPQALNADGTNSVINLRELTNCSGEQQYDLTFEASSGGQIVLTNLPSAQWTSFTFNSGGTIDVPKMTNIFDSSILVNAASLTLAALSNIDGSSLNVSGGGTFTLPAVGNFSGTTSIQPIWEASGAGSVLSLLGLTNLVGNFNAVQMQINAESGGEVLLNNLQAIDSGYIQFLSDGTGSSINLTGLTGFVIQSGQGSLTAQNSGTILLNNQAFLLANVSINIPAGNPVLPPTLIASSTLTLYGQPWHSYLIEERNTAVTNSPFAFLEYVPLTNAFEAIAPAPKTNTAYLVTDFAANPPILSLLKVTNGVELVLYGLTNGTYDVQTATNLTRTMTWTDYAVVTMTNAFRIFPTVAPSGRELYYRAKN